MIITRVLIIPGVVFDEKIENKFIIFLTMFIMVAYANDESDPKQEIHFLEGTWHYDIHKIELSDRLVYIEMENHIGATGVMNVDYALSIANEGFILSSLSWEFETHQPYSVFFDTRENMWIVSFSENGELMIGYLFTTVHILICEEGWIKNIWINQNLPEI